MCDHDPDETHLGAALASPVFASGEDRDVFKCGSWVFKRERSGDPDSVGSNLLEHENASEARSWALPEYLHIPRTRILEYKGLDILASEFIDGQRMIECEQAYGGECERHDQGICLSAQQMLEIRDLTGLYDFAEGNVIGNDDGLYLVDLTLCAFDQPLTFEE